MAIGESGPGPAACGRGEGGIGSKIQKDLEPLLAHRWSGAELAGVVDQAVDELEDGRPGRLPARQVQEGGRGSP